MLELKTFGGLSVEKDGDRSDGAAGRKRTLALLAILAVAGKRGVSRDKLIAYLWPETDTAHGRHLLKQACYALRRDLRAPDLFLGATELRLNPEIISSDVQAFEDALARGDRARAVSVYAAPFLDGFYLNGQGDFERWVEGERGRLKQLAGEALEALATEAALRGDHTAAADWWRRRAALDPLSSRAAIGLMRALAASGDRAGALLHARVHENLLSQELDVAPERAVIEFVRRLRDTTPALPDSPTETWAVGAAEPWKEAVVPHVLRAVPPRSRRAVQVKTWLLVGVVLAVLAVALYSRFKTARLLDPDLVAVAPFDVLTPRLGLWREGLVDVLSHSLDGAGPLRTVSPTVVIRAWKGHADPLSAAELGRKTGARLVLFGELLGAGGDSVRLTATLLDAATNRSLTEVELRDESARVDRLADSLTVDLLRQLGRTRPIGTVRVTSLGSTSLTALKAFLQGEQLYRRAIFDSAVPLYRRAVALDTTFALAFHHLANASEWLTSGTDSLSNTYLARAGAYNYRLSPRDSLLVTVDFLSAPLYGYAGDTLFPKHAGGLFATLNVAVRRYPDDPAVWYALGDAGYHFGIVYGRTLNGVLGAFDRAISLDSAYTPSYIHATEIGSKLSGPTGLRHYAEPYLALTPRSPNAAGIELAVRLVDPAQAHSPELRQLVDTGSPDLLLDANAILRHWPDSAETAIRLARKIQISHRASTPGYYSDPESRLFQLVRALAFRGHVRESYAVSGGRFRPHLVAWALLNVIPNDSAISWYAQVLRGELRTRALALPWLAARNDTVTLQAVGRQVDSVGRRSPHQWQRDQARYLAGAVRAYLSLARYDSAAALAGLSALPDSLCLFCENFLHDLVRAQLLRLRGAHRDAAALLDRDFRAFQHPLEVLWILERARVHDRLGDKDQAIDAYRFVADVWRHADPELQPFVVEARTALQRLEK
jgi:serine/threonine-protein kinase